MCTGFSFMFSCFLFLSAPCAVVLFASFVNLVPGVLLHICLLPIAAIAHPGPTPRMRLTVSKLSCKTSALVFLKFICNMGLGFLNWSLRELLSACYAENTVQWLGLPSLPVALADVSMGVLDGNVYVIGLNENGSQPISSGDTYVLDLQSNDWKKLPARPCAGFQHAAEVLGGRWYIFGGRDASGNLVCGDLVQVGNLVLDPWV